MKRPVQQIREAKWQLELVEGVKNKNIDEILNWVYLKGYFHESNIGQADNVIAQAKRWLEKVVLKGEK